MNDYISKPFDPINLYLKIKKVLNQHTAIIEKDTISSADFIQHDGIINLHFLSERASGDLEYIKEILQTFNDTFPDYLNEFVNTAEQKDWEALKKQAHRMKGAVDYIKVEQLTLFLKNIELGNINPEQDDNWQQQLKNALQMCEQIKRELKLILDKINNIVS